MTTFLPMLFATLYAMAPHARATEIDLGDTAVDANCLAGTCSSTLNRQTTTGSSLAFSLTEGASTAVSSANLATGALRVGILQILLGAATVGVAARRSRRAPGSAPMGC